MKTPAWAKDKTDIYFLVLDENRNSYAYIGLQDVDLNKGICNNLCYKTHKKFRGQKRSKHYLKEFIEWCPLNFDVFKATVRKDNIPSIKMLEFCGFEKLQSKSNSIEDEIKDLELELAFFQEGKSDIVKNPVNKDKAKNILEDKEQVLKNKINYLKKRLGRDENKYVSYKLKRFDF